MDRQLSGGGHVVFLLDVRDRFEASQLHRWVDKRYGHRSLRMNFVRLGTRRTHSRLVDILGQAGVDDTPAGSMPGLWFQPLRIAWFSGTRRSGASLGSDFFYGHMTQPGFLRRRWIAANEPKRMRVVSGAGAWVADIHASYQARSNRSTNATGTVDTSGSGFADWVQEQAYLVLEVAERVARGPRYKIARLLPQQIFHDKDFQRRLASIAGDQQLSLAQVRCRADRYLREMAASQTPFTVDLITALYRAGTRSNHDAHIDIKPEQLRQVAELMTDRPAIFLISHKSMLDTCAFSLVLFDANLSIPLTFGGINLSTPGVGALARRAGIIFLRRSFQDNAVYKAVFRRYIDHLIEKRFSLLWALEGTRSRTGKLSPPRFGLFNYVVESILRTRLLNTAFIPVSVAYDQITEVEDYATEQRGESKQSEGKGWMLRFFRGGKSHGRIFVRFGQPTCLTDLRSENELPAELSDTERAGLSQTLAFQMALQMNAATPVTAIAVITLILLASGTRAMTLQEIQSLGRSAAILVRRRQVELVGHNNLRHAASLRATLGQLHDTAIVSFHDDGVERLYSIRPEQHHKAAYYRNTAIHHFLVDAIVEIALLMTAQEVASASTSPERDAMPAANSADARGTTQPGDRFVDIAIRLRGIFKFEFYFARKAQFRMDVIAHANDRLAGWQQALKMGRESPREINALMVQVKPLVAHGVLRSFVDAYSVVASNLVRHADDDAGKSSEFVAQCLKLGQQQLRQAQISSPESVSRTLYQTAFKLTEHRGLNQSDRLVQRRNFDSLVKRAASSLDTIVRLTA